MKKLMLLSALGLSLMAVPSVQAAPVAFGVGIGVGPVVVGAPPVCAYGYYSYYPYACAPYCYYGPQWFVGGVFIGAGPWFHGFNGRPGYYGHPGYVGHPGFYGRQGFRGGPVARGPVHVDRAPAARGFRSGAVRGGPVRGGFHGGRGR